jgi:hypothetical protein
MGKTPTPAHRASAQLHNALRDALACVCASCSCCCACVLAGLLFGLGSCAAYWVFCSFFLLVMLSSMLCVRLFVYVIMRDHECCNFHGGARRAFLHTGDIACPQGLSQHAGNEEATAGTRTMPSIAQSHKHQESIKTPGKLLCWGRSYRGQSYRRNSCLVPRHMTECRAQRETTTRRRSPWTRQMKPETFPPLAIAGAQLSWLPSV